MASDRQEPNLGVLLFVAYRALEERAHDAVVAAGFADITPAQARIAARIGPSGTRVSDLAEQARVTKQTAAFLVEQLEAKGYLQRIPDPSDRRARLVQLTPRAEPVVAAANAAVEQAFAEWADHVGTQRLQQLYEILRDLREITDRWQ